MGIEDRHYFRDGRYSSSFTSYGPGTWPPVCKFIIFANIGVFLLQILVTRPATIEDLQRFYGDEYFQALTVDPDSGKQKPNDESTAGESEKQKEPQSKSPSGTEPTQSGPDEYEYNYPYTIEETLEMMPRVSVVQGWLELNPEKVARGQLWRVITCAFCHDRYGFWHILFNLLFIYWFGRTLELMYGSREFLFFYICAIFVSSCTYLLLALVTGDMIPAIGASGGVMAIVVLYAMHFPREQIYIYFLFPIEIRWIVLVYVLYDVYPVLLVLGGVSYYDGVGHAAHLGGLAFGFLYWTSGIRFSEFWDRLNLPSFGNSKGAQPKWGAQPKLKVLKRPSKQEDESETDAIDEILRQINDQGIDSLDEEQKRLLEKESKKLKKR